MSWAIPTVINNRSGIEMYKSFRYILAQNNSNAMRMNGVEADFRNITPWWNLALSVIRLSESPEIITEIHLIKYMLLF